MDRIFKRLYFIGFAGYLFLFVFSILFFKERTIFCDIAFHLFLILKDNTFVPNFRFGAFFTQLYPLFAARAGMSLSSVMMAYSVGFIFYHFIYFLICGLVCRRYQFGLCILLFNLLFLSHTFYWMQSELPQAINLFILVLAVASTVKSNDIKPLALAVIFLGLFIVVFTHPLAIFPVVYCIIFFLLSKDEPVIDKKLLYSIFIFSIGTYLIKVTFFQGGYDSQAMSTVHSLPFKNIFSIYSNVHFVHNCFIKYYWIPILSLLVFTYYLVRKDWRKCILFCLFMIGYLELVNLTHANSDGYDFYIENQYLPLGIFIALPLVFDVFPAIKKKYVAELFFTVILATGCIRIYNTHESWSARLNWERHFLVENEGKKMIVDEKKTPVNLLLMTWGTPLEFWLLSTTEYKRSASVIITGNPESYMGFIDSSKSLIVTGGLFPYSTLSGRYFKFEDTSSHYSVIR